MQITTITLIISFATLFTCSLGGTESAKDSVKVQGQPAKESVKVPEHSEHVSRQRLIKLTSENMAILKGRVESSTIDIAVRDLVNTQTDDIYLYIDSPGGSVIAGSDLIETLEMLKMKGKTVHCIADMAASMGFAILQSCEDRLVRENSLLMQHQMSVMTHGELEKVKSKMNLYDQLHASHVQRESKRLGLTVEEYEKKVMNEWYIYGAQALTCNAADDVVKVDCDQHLLNSEYTIVFYTFFGPVEVAYSKCPLLKPPTSIKLKRDDTTQDIHNMSDDTVKDLFNRWDSYCKNYEYKIIDRSDRLTCDPIVKNFVFNEIYKSD